MKIQLNKVLFIVLTCLTLSATSQKIRIKVNAQKDTTVYLIKYFGQKLFYADTAEMKAGEVVFDGKKQQPGIVGLYLPGQRYFEFVYNNEDVQLETTGPDFMATMKVKKSAENTVFIPYVNFISGKKSNINKLAEERSKLKNQDSKDPEYKRLSDQIDGINTEVEDYQKLLINNNQGKLVAKIVKMSMEIDIPEPPKNDKGIVTDSSFKYKFYKKHYWDNVDLKDDALVNNPVFHNKMEYYFGKNMIIQHWDTVIAHAFDFCDRLNPKSKMFEYVVGWVASTYGKSEIMGMDKVYLYMLDRYFCTKNAEGKYPAFWVDEAKIPELCDNLKNKLNVVMGVRPPNLILRDTTDVTYRDFYSLKSEYTILYFWDPECGHCKKSTPKLGRLYEEKLKARNVEVFAIGKATGKDFESWKKFIRDNNLKFINVAVTEKLFEIAKKEPEKLVPMYPGEKGKPTTLESLNYQTTYDIFSNPVVYILDKDKKIIAKRVSISQIEDILDRLQGYQNSAKLFEPESFESEKEEQNKVEEVDQEIIKTDKEISEELQEIINSQVKDERYISPEVKIDVNVKTENLFIDGKKETNIHVDYMYEVVKLSAENKTDDFPSGSYVLEKSNAALFTMNFIKKTLEGKLSQYLYPNRQVIVKIKGYTDGSPISGNIVYKGEYGGFNGEPFFFNSDITTTSISKNKTFNSNRELGYLRTAGVRDFIQNKIDILKNCDLSFEHEVIVEDGIGSSFRKISVEIIIKDAFNVPKAQIKESNSKTNNIDYESLYLKCKKSVFMIEILNYEGGSQGSGFIISSDGIAISNHHVFKDGFWKTALIHLDDGTTTTVEKVIEQDPDKDYIVFKLKNNREQPFDKLNLTNEIPKVASEVFAIGNPEGFTKSFSKGEISAYRLNYQLLQTTTPITHGSSGGPLFNSKGEVVGITSGTFNSGSNVYDLKGNVIGWTENGGQGNLYKAINILALKLDKYVK